MKYAVSYDLSSGHHTRYYNALDSATALAMFNETCREGSLTGSSPRNITVRRIAVSPSSVKKD